MRLHLNIINGGRYLFKEKFAPAHSLQLNYVEDACARVRV